MSANALNQVGPGDALDIPHIRNFLNAIKTGEKLNSDIESGYKSTLAGSAWKYCPESWSFAGY